MKRILLLLIAVLMSFHLFAQAGNAVFDDSKLHEIRINFEMDAWFDSLTVDYKYNLRDQADTIPDRYFECAMAFDGIKLESVGFRQKGNSSYQFTQWSNANGLKVPFKLKTDAFINQKLDGLKELNLNNFASDPSYIKEPIMYSMLRQQGVPAPRTSYARLYVNDIYWGLYLIVENVDKTFLKRHFGTNNDEGNLYKTKRGAQVFLNDLGNDAAEYIDAGLLLKTNEEENDWSTFLHFIQVVNHTPKDSMRTELPKVMDVDTYLDIMALEVVAYSWDNYWSGGNNFYLYEHPDGRIRWIPWDVNETLSSKAEAVFPFISDIFVSRNINNRPLIKAIFGVREWQDKYLDKVCYLCDSVFCPQNILPQVSAWQDIIRDAIADDTNALGTYEAFSHSLTDDTFYDLQILRNWEPFNIRERGLIPFISARRTWALNQIKKQGGTCAVENYTPEAYDIYLAPNPAIDELHISWAPPRTGLYQFVVYNMLGVNVLQTEWRMNNNAYDAIQIGQLPKGVYWLQKRDADGFWGIGKLVKVD